MTLLSASSMIKTASTIFNILFVIIGIGLVAFAVYMLFFNGKGEAKNQLSKTSAADREIVNSRDFLKDVEDIKDGIIITDHGTRFIAAIKAGGYSFYDDDLSGQLHTMVAFQSFFITTNGRGPMTYRTSSHMIDVDKPKERYTKRIAELSKQYKELADVIDKTSPNDPGREKLIKKADGLADTIEHLDAQLYAINLFSSSETISDTYQCYLFEWKFRSSDYGVNISPDEVFNIAKVELENMAKSYINVLNDAKVHAKMLNQTEMLELFRRQSKPVTSEAFPLKNFMDSSFDEDIITSTSIIEKYNEAAEELELPKVEVPKGFRISAGGED